MNSRTEVNIYVNVVNLYNVKNRIIMSKNVENVCETG